MKLKVSKNKISTFQKVFIGALVLSLLLIVATPFLTKPKNSLTPAAPQYIDTVGYINYEGFQSFPNKKNVLFFKANWCSTCSVADENFLSEMRSIPTYLTIYKVDFEKEVALKQKYGVSSQHTFVQVDFMGNALRKWEGGYTIQSILDKLV